MSDSSFAPLERAQSAQGDRAERTARHGPGPSDRTHASTGPGEPLDPTTRSRFEPYFGESLTDVRVHTGSDTSLSATDLRASAYTLGGDIVFAPGRYDPNSRSGRGLLAHELAHVVQQRRGGPNAPISSIRHEQEADRAAAGIAIGTSPPALTGSAPGIARAPDDWSLPEGNPERWVDEVPNTEGMQQSELLDEATQIQEWVDRQNSTTPELIRLEEVQGQFMETAEKRMKTASRAKIPKPKPKRNRRKPPAQTSSPSADDRPRMLREGTSLGSDDPAALRAEYDEIVAYLQRKGIPKEDRKLLQVALDNLAPGIVADLSQRSARRRGAYVDQVIQKETGGDARKMAKLLDEMRPYTEQPGNEYVVRDGEVIVFREHEAAQMREWFNSQVLRTYANQLENSQRLLDEGEEAMDHYRKRTFGSGKRMFQARLAWLTEASKHLEDEELFNAREDGLLSLMAYHGKRAVTGFGRTAKSFVVEPFYQLHDLGLAAGGYFFGMEVEDSDLISNTAEATRQGVPQHKLILAAIPGTSIGVATYDMTRSAIEGRWGDFSEQAGGLLPGVIVGKLAGSSRAAPSRFVRVMFPVLNLGAKLPAIPTTSRPVPGSQGSGMRGLAQKLVLTGKLMTGFDEALPGVTRSGFGGSTVAAESTPTVVSRPATGPGPGPQSPAEPALSPAATGGEPVRSGGTQSAPKPPAPEGITQPVKPASPEAAVPASSPGAATSPGTLEKAAPGVLRRRGGSAQPQETSAPRPFEQSAPAEDPFVDDSAEHADAVYEGSGDLGERPTAADLDTEAWMRAHGHHWGEAAPRPDRPTAGSASSSTSPGERLRASMKQQGISILDDDHAHHMVASKGGGEAGDRARAVLDDAGISLDDGVNGVGLKGPHPNALLPNDLAPPHLRIHTEAYYEWVAGELESVAGQPPDVVMGKLSSIRIKILEWDFPWR